MDRLRRALSGDRTVLTAWIGTPGRAWVEMIAPHFDAVTIDMQHGMWGEGEALAALGSVATSGKPALLRIPVGRFDLASRALDGGAHGVIAPMINSVNDAKSFAAALKYPPMGERSYGPTVAVRALGLAGPSEYVLRANSETMAIAMIETRAAFDALDDILDVEGIDAVFMGPADFSVSIRGGGMPEPFGEDTREMVAKVAEKARAKNKVAAAFAVTSAMTNEAHAMGYRLIAPGMDSRYVVEGVRGIMDGLDFPRG